MLEKLALSLVKHLATSEFVVKILEAFKESTKNTVDDKVVDFVVGFIQSDYEKMGKAAASSIEAVKESFSDEPTKDTNTISKDLKERLNKR